MYNSSVTRSNSTLETEEIIKLIPCGELRIFYFLVHSTALILNASLFISAFLKLNKNHFTNAILLTTLFYNCLYAVYFLCMETLFYNCMMNKWILFFNFNYMIMSSSWHIQILLAHHRYRLIKRPMHENESLTKKRVLLVIFNFFFNTVTWLIYQSSVYFVCKRKICQNVSLLIILPVHGYFPVFGILVFSILTLKLIKAKKKSAQHSVGIKNGDVYFSLNKTRPSRFVREKKFTYYLLATSSFFLIFGNEIAVKPFLMIFGLEYPLRSYHIYPVHLITLADPIVLLIFYRSFRKAFKSTFLCSQNLNEK